MAFYIIRDAEPGQLDPRRRWFSDGQGWSVRFASARRFATREAAVLILGTRRAKIIELPRSDAALRNPQSEIANPS